MLNYIKADLTRIFKRIPRAVVMLISFAVFCLAIFIYVSVLRIFSDPTLVEAGFGFAEEQNPVYTAIMQVVGYAVGLLGLFELIFVFSDDFKAKTTQIAIGVGVSRVKVVFSKFFELLTLMLVDMVILLGLSTLMSVLLGDPLNGAQMAELVGKLTVGMLLGNMGYCCLVFVLLFTTQSMTIGILAFLALHFHVVSGVIGLTSYVDALAGLNLGSYTLTSMLGKAGNMVNGAAFSLVPFLAIAVYIIVPLAVTALLFSKKELEF